ncbi:MAG: ethylbenzene dehydrogenase-related protein [Planctomycetota bacterium]
MRLACLLLPLPLLAACERETAPRAPAEVARLRVVSLPPEARVVVDGAMADHAWTRASELVVRLEGKGAPEVRLKAVHDAERIYLLAVWQDPARSMGRYWEYRGGLRWELHTGEDGFAICWSPGAHADAFRAQGCALFCHQDRHVHPEPGTGYVDFWYWGAQQTNLHAQARDMWLRQGREHRLRGDPQPADSDNIYNHSNRYRGPLYLPRFVTRQSERILLADNLREVTPDWIQRYWEDARNVGRQVPLDVLRPRRGSRGDVLAKARHHEGKGWVLELSRALETGHLDDQPLGDPLVAAYFSVAVYNDAAGADHHVSGPIELRFLAAD